MTEPAAAKAFLVSEAEALEPFDYVAVVPTGRVHDMVEITRTEEGGLELRVPGRPRSVPPLEGNIQSALAERGLSSEDAGNPEKPWIRAADTPDAAVDLALTLLTDVFANKPDAALDVGHGSHRMEHEASQKLALARARIESIVTDLLGHAPKQDADSDYVLPIGEVHVMVAPRAALSGQIVTRVFAITNVGFAVVPELGLFLARLNFGLMFGRFALDAEHNSIWFDESLLGDQFREEELRFAIEMVASTADGWDDRLKQMFGGATYQEVLAGRSDQGAPPVKPGEGTGQYL